jgi:hypothetical protein
VNLFERGPFPVPIVEQHTKVAGARQTLHIPRLSVGPAVHQDDLLCATALRERDQSKMMVAASYTDYDEASQPRSVDISASRFRG